ncbi:MAG: hypothetical protein R2786_09910 [Flavobacteriaceae bacterium]
MKKLLNLQGAQLLSKNELKSIQGGGRGCGAPGSTPCPDGQCCGVDHNCHPDGHPLCFG